MSTPNKTSHFNPNNPDADPVEPKEWKPSSLDKSNVTIPPQAKERQRKRKGVHIQHDDSPYKV